MRTLIHSIVVGLWLIPAGSNAQNLVADPGFEDTLQCPNWIGQFNSLHLANWERTTIASSDLHNLCGYNNFMPRSGDGYAGLLFHDPTEYREYISGDLTSALEPGVCYYVEFFVARGSNSLHAIDEIQAHFSVGMPLDFSSPPPAPLPLTPHVEASSTASATTYQKISGFYTAAGGENAITIGNFMDNANTTLTQMQSSGAGNTYYFVDDVMVTRLDLGADKAICAGDTAEIIPNIQCPDMDYQWSTGSTAQSVFVSSAGPVWVEISGNGTCSVSDTVNIILQDPPDAGVGGEDTICTNAMPIDLFDLLSGTPDPNGQWTDPNGNNISSIVDPATAMSGSYAYFVSGNGICPNATAILDLYFDPCLSVASNATPSKMKWLGQSGTIHQFEMNDVNRSFPIQLVDVHGRTMDVDPEWNGDRVLLNLAGKASGVYFLQIPTEKLLMIRFAHH